MRKSVNSIESRKIYIDINNLTIYRKYIVSYREDKRILPLALRDTNLSLNLWLNNTRTIHIYIYIYRIYITLRRRPNVTFLSRNMKKWNSKRLRPNLSVSVLLIAYCILNVIRGFNCSYLNNYSTSSGSRYDR